MVDHPDDRRHPGSFVADERAPRPVELDLAGRVGPVARLVLEPLDADRVASAVRAPTGNGEARQSGGSLSEHQEQIAHRRRAEPLVAGEDVSVICRGRPGGVGAHVAAALLLRHRHPGERAVLAGCRLVPPVVHRRRQSWLPLLGEIRIERAAPARSSRSSRSGTHARPPPASTRRSGPPARRGRRPDRRPTGRRGGRRPLPRSSASGRQGGTRRRRCDDRSGRTDAARARSRWPARPSG